MAPFSLLSSYGFMGVHVSGSTQSKTLYIRDNIRIHVGTPQPLVRHRGFGSLDSNWHDSSVFVHLVGRINCCKSQFGVSCDDERTRIQKKNVDKHPTVSKNINLRKRFSLRFRARLRLLSMRLKRVSIQAILEEFGVFLRRNSKRVTISTFISVVLGLCYLFLKLTAVPSPEAAPYSDLIMNLQNGSVSKVLFEEGSRRIFYNTVSKSPDNPQLLKKELPIGDVQLENSGDTDLSVNGKRSPSLKPVDMLRRLSRKQVTTPEWQFSTRRIEYDEKFLLSLMREKGTAYTSAPQSVIMSMRNILVTILSLWIPLTPFMWLLYRQFSAANSPAKKRRPSNQTISFDDVEGVDTAKAELTEVVLCLQGAVNYAKLGAKLPRGVLLVGPPGTGKTLLARAVAGEAGVPFFSVSASEFVELFVGRGAARIRDLFAAARKHAPSIIFIDELDAVGGKRGRSFNDERDQTLNQLLTELDGFDTDMKVVVIGATNRPEALDPALCRPGRFSRKIFVGHPDEEGRRKILAVHLRGVPLEEDPQIICSLIASLTQGFVGADLANIINEAALLAARRGSESVTREDVMESIERAKFGINDRRLNPGTIRKELGKLFPWMQSLMAKNDPRENGSDGPLGYQALS